MVRYSPANAKIKQLALFPALKAFLSGKRKVYSLDLLSGWSCPFAKACLSKVHEDSQGKRTVKDGPHTEFRCFSASQEALFPHVYNLRKANFHALRDAKSVQKKMDLLVSAMPHNMGVCRIDVGGDIFNQQMFDAWLGMAKKFPSVLWYAYTKSLPFWLERRRNVTRQDNFVLTASYGGVHDNLIKSRRLRFANVIADEAICQAIYDGELESWDGLPIDHDDSHAANPAAQKQNFSLLVHGTQPAGSEASRARVALRGVGSYSK